MLKLNGQRVLKLPQVPKRLGALISFAIWKKIGNDVQLWLAHFRF